MDINGTFTATGLRKQLEDLPPNEYLDFTDATTGITYVILRKDGFEEMKELAWRYLGLQD